MSTRNESGITVNHDADGTPREVRYLTDDRDSRNRAELVIGWGNNGDWYVYVAPEGEVSVHAVRLCTSGGISSRVLGVNPHVAQIFKLLAEMEKEPLVAQQSCTCISKVEGYRDRYKKAAAAESNEKTELVLIHYYHAANEIIAQLKGEL